MHLRSLPALNYLESLINLGVQNAKRLVPLSLQTYLAVHTVSFSYGIKKCVYKKHGIVSSFKNVLQKTNFSKKRGRLFLDIFCWDGLPPVRDGTSPHVVSKRGLLYFPNCCQVSLRPGPTLFRSIPVRECQVFFDLYFLGSSLEDGFGHPLEREKRLFFQVDFNRHIRYELV